jgi:hypothetical protein
LDVSINKEVVDLLETVHEGLLIKWPDRLGPGVIRNLLGLARHNVREIVIRSGGGDNLVLLPPLLMSIVGRVVLVIIVVPRNVLPFGRNATEEPEFQGFAHLTAPVTTATVPAATVVTVTATAGKPGRDTGPNTTKNCTPINFLPSWVGHIL